MMLRELFQVVANRSWRTSRLRADPRRISVGIPTYNRAERVLALVPTLLQDPRVGEVVVRDDASAPADYAKLERGLSAWAPRVRLQRNAANRGAFANKLAVIADCREAWALLLDSDNRASSRYLDVLYALPAWSSRVVYCPAWARPAFDFTALAGAPLDLRAAGWLLAGAKRKQMSVFLNTGNYMVPVREYVESLEPFVDRRVKAADVFFANLLWLRRGGLLYSVPGLVYDHDVHDGSWFRATAEDSKRLIRELTEAWIADDPERLDRTLATAGKNT